MNRRILIGLVLFASLLFGATPVFAHANLVRSDPPANSAQKTPPTRVRLWFSEAVEPSFSSVSVLDKNGDTVDKKDSHRLADDPTGMEVSLTDLPQGLYTVVWKTMSAVDGHITSGSFSFTVGDVPLTDSSPREIMSLVDSALSAAAPPPLYEIVIRWLNLLLLALLVGSLTFPLFVLLPAIHAATSPQSILRVYVDYVRHLVAGRGKPSPAYEDRALGAWAKAWLASNRLMLVLFALITLAVLGAQALKSGSDLGAVVPVLTATRFGAIWLARVVLLVGLGFVLFRGRWHWTQDMEGNRLLFISIALGLLLLVTQSLNSHDAAVNDPPVLPFFVDLVHLAGVTIWVGGLAQLVVTLPTYLRAQARSDRIRYLASTIACFSLVAFLTVGIVILSGAYSLILQVGTLEALFNTLYGTTLFVKFVLILPLLALGGLNLIVNRPASAQTMIERLQPFVRRFDIAVLLELIFAAGVLFAVGIMTSVAPARSAYDPNPKLWLETHRADDLTVTLGVAPALAGTNDFDVQVQDARGQNVSNAAVVRLIGTMEGMDMGPQEVEATAQGNGHYTLHGELMSMVGTWQLVVLVRRLGVDDVRTTFSLLALGQRLPQQPPIVTTSAQAQAGLGLTVLGLMIGTACALAIRRQRVRWATMVGALVVASAGAALAYQAVASAPAAPAFVPPLVPEIARLARSPIPPIPAHIEQGHQVYLQNCAICHGVSGKGDGSQAAGLTPRPADLTVHARQHTEGELYWWVTNGIATTAMPAWQTSLTDTQRWQVVGYIRTLGQPAPTPSAQSAAP